MPTSAIKQREYRQRRARGLRVIAVEVDEVRLIEALLRHHLLRACDEDDHDKISAALQTAVEHWIESA